MDLSVSFFTSLLLIVFIDLALSGDNAVVIAMAASRLEPKFQKQAIWWGVAGALVLRILATIFVLYLLGIPWLRLIGGILLLWIAYKLLLPEEDEGGHKIKASSNVFKAIGIIVMADATMAFDNMMGVAGVANGSMSLVIFGLVLSVPIMVAGARIIMKAMERFPWLIYVGAGILAYTAAHMVLQEPALGGYINAWGKVLYPIAVFAVLCSGYYKRKTA